ncbi:unnamed protein product [Bursaphelenchus okinawaensis]|uniref:G-protein coupled receptors family 1 profile domain-containing protein n=1 Tax=Bursaphelenchus okinawaensis TaxID=465554 RepID=A0A811LQD5_9BILA|nr:unnamed protein product [Bursaphelenchus okinawaensis]CAG9126482.1 unnamed protein product [Bursaphelenchus okinawaensis]
MNESVPDDLFLEPPPADAWCFDLIMFYKTTAEDDEQARNVLLQLESYARFSFVVNGVITCLLASFGLLGNSMFVYQIHKSRYFSRRLACHLTMLCMWDMALLLCCLLTYGIISLYYGIMPFVGIIAYLLYFFQPFASFCVTGTIWQVLAITIERYTAVSKPLEQRTRNAQFSVRSICAGIALGAFLLNMVVVPFERELKDCYEFTPSGFELRTMISTLPLVNNQYYAILVHLIPDIIFRAPLPIIAIACLTIRTLQICSRRTVGSQTIHARRNIHYMLTLLNIKFIMCNTLYMVNTVLMEVMGYGGKTSSQQTEIDIEQYIRSLYLTDLSNMLLALHSATNWLIFYHWPRFMGHKKYSNIKITTLSNSSKTVAIDQEIAELLLSRFSAHKYKISTEVLTVLCRENPTIANALLGSDLNEAKNVKGKEAMEKHQLQQVRLQRHGVLLANAIEEVLFALTSKNFSVIEWKDLCRQIGYSHWEVNNYCGADQWKLVRDTLMASINNHATNQWPGANFQQISSSNIQKTMVRVFNFALREMKSGALCAVVDYTQQPRINTQPGRMGTAAACTTALASSALAFGPKRNPIPSGFKSDQKPCLKALDSIGNSSLESYALDSPIHSRTRTMLSRLSIFTRRTDTTDYCESPLEKPFVF